MIRLTDYPLLVFAMAALLLALSTRFGSGPLRRWRPLDSDVVDDFRVVQGAMLTLLGLIIGFTFSMAISRFDQRKNLEEGEANAIGTEYVRADLLPAAEGAKVRALLRAYTEERIRFYTVRGRNEEAVINARTAQLQNELWAAIVPAATANCTPSGEKSRPPRLPKPCSAALNVRRTVWTPSGARTASVRHVNRRPVLVSRRTDAVTAPDSSR